MKDIDYKKFIDDAVETSATALKQWKAKRDRKIKLINEHKSCLELVDQMKYAVEHPNIQNADTVLDTTHSHNNIRNIKLIPSDPQFSKKHLEKIYSTKCTEFQDFVNVTNQTNRYVEISVVSSSVHRIETIIEESNKWSKASKIIHFNLY